MRSQRTILVTLGVLAGSAALASPTLASGPLLSGYGGPGAGAQTIIGATLLNGPGGSGGSRGGGSGSGPAVGGAAIAAPASGARGVSASTTGAGAGSAGSTPGGARGATALHGHVTHHRAAGATPISSHRRGLPIVQEGSTTAAPWFSGSDITALVLVAAVLAIVAVATVRLAIAGRGQESMR